MKKCLIISNLSDTVYLFLKPLISILKEYKYEIYIICGKGKYINQIYEISNNIYEFEFKKIDKKYLFNLYKIIKKTNVDIVITNDPKASFFGRIISRIVGIKKIVYYCHGLPFASHSNIYEKIIYFGLEYIASFFTTHNIVMNKYDYHILKKINKKTYHINGVGVETSLFDYKIRNIESNKKNIIFIGRLIKRKGIFEFLEIAKNERGKKYNFLIYGDGDDNIKDKIYKFTKKTNNISYVGYKNYINEIFENAFIFLFPSKYTEGIPRVIMESMLYGVPVIASKIRGNKDIVKNGYNGYLFEFNNNYIEHIYSLIDKIDSDEKQRRYIIKNAKKCIYDKYSTEMIKKEYKYIISKIEKS